MDLHWAVWAALLCTASTEWTPWCNTNVGVGSLHRMSRGVFDEPWYTDNGEWETLDNALHAQVDLSPLLRNAGSDAPNGQGTKGPSKLNVAGQRGRQHCSHTTANTRDKPSPRDQLRLPPRMENKQDRQPHTPKLHTGHTRSLKVKETANQKKGTGKYSLATRGAGVQQEYPTYNGIEAFWM